jgi:hypothetical protein
LYVAAAFEIELDEKNVAVWSHDGTSKVAFFQRRRSAERTAAQHVVAEVRADSAEVAAAK